MLVPKLCTEGGTPCWCQNWVPREGPHAGAKTVYRGRDPMPVPKLCTEGGTPCQCKNFVPGEGPHAGAITKSVLIIYLNDVIHKIFNGLRRKK